MQKIKCRTAFNARDEEHTGIEFTQPSLTQQHFKQEADVNYIVSRYLQTGQMENVNEQPPLYGDISSFGAEFDLRAAYEAVGRAEEGFLMLPSDVRKKLDNDPSKLISWLSDESNRADAIKYGLFNAPEPAQKVDENILGRVSENPVVTPTPAPSAPSAE